MKQGFAHRKIKGKQAAGKSVVSGMGKEEE
jgi:hypothetical protein